MQIYVVKEKDTVDRIGQMFSVDPLELAWANQIEPPYRLAVGQALLIPDRGSMLRVENAVSADDSVGSGRREVRLGGYAYPWIDASVLAETASYLTEISVFSYGFTETGSLIYPREDGERHILSAANSQGVMPVLVLTPLDEEGRFNSNLISVLVRNVGIQQRLIRELLGVVQEKAYGGINVDFEYVLAEDGDNFVNFVERLHTVMSVFGIRVTVALAPKTSRDQKGVLYEGIDYRALGELVDGVFLMTYEWGYTYGPPMAVAPLNMVRRVVEYAVSEISPSKIMLGIPNYGYDWPLPFEQGTTKAQSLGYTEAISLAIDHGVPVYYNETSQSPYFFYWQYGIRHEVWFEDIRSVQGKFSLIKEYNLAGGGYWQLMRLFRASWLLAAEEFRIEKV